MIYDLASKIPCFIYDPRLPKQRQGVTSAKLVSSLDITRTILDYAEVPATEFMSGRSLRPLMLGNVGGWRNELFLESLYTGRDNPFQEGIRTKSWKYIRMFDGIGKYKETDVDFSDRKPEFEMLFDLSVDPDEKKNLIGQMENSEVLAGLRQKCAAQSETLNQRREEFKAVMTTRGRS